MQQLDWVAVLYYPLNPVATCGSAFKCEQEIIKITSSAISIGSPYDDNIIDQNPKEKRDATEN